MPGPGNRDIDFLGKAISLVSVSGPTECTIDVQASATDPHRGFYLHSGEGPSSVLRGFTIMNAYLSPDWYGVGICCCGSSPTIAGNTVIGNTASSTVGHVGYGGGIGCNSSSSPHHSWEYMETRQSSRRSEVLVDDLLLRP